MSIFLTSVSVYPQVPGVTMATDVSVDRHNSFRVSIYADYTDSLKVLATRMDNSKIMVFGEIYCPDDWSIQLSSQPDNAWANSLGWRSDGTNSTMLFRDFRFDAALSCHSWLSGLSTLLQHHDGVVDEDRNVPTDGSVFRTARLSLLSQETTTEDKDRFKEEADLRNKLESFYRTPKMTFHPVIYFSGHASDTVYVYLHGLFEGTNTFEKFAEHEYLEADSNSVLAVLPGQEADGAAGEIGKTLALYSPNDWISYAEATVGFARKLGKRVVVVGKSLGGLLGLILAARNEVDGAILFQPALSMTAKATFLSYFGGILGPFKHVQAQETPPLGGRMVSRLITDILGCGEGDLCLRDSNGNIHSGSVRINVPTRIYLAKNDEYVNSREVKAIVDGLQSPSISIIWHNNGHDFVPDDFAELESSALLKDSTRVESTK